MQDRDHETYVHDHTPARDVIEAADPDEGPWPIHGVAVAAGDILHDQDGNPVLITSEALENAQYSKAAQKLTKDHPDYDPAHEPPPVDATVGNNSMGYTDDGEAVVYDATTHDEDIAAGVNGGSYDVSVHAAFRSGDPDPETGIPLAEDIVFHDTSVVTIGDSPSNTAQYGGRSDVAAWARSGGLEAAVSDMADTPAGAPDPDDETVGLLRGLANRWGFSLEAGAGGAQQSDEGPDSLPDKDPDEDDDATDTTMTNRDDHIQFITAHSHFDEEVLADMDDEELEQTKDLVDDDGDDDEDSTDDQTDDQTADTLGDMTPDQLGDVLREQGFVTEDEVDDRVEASRSAASKGEQVDEIIANSEDYSEDDREELMASSSTVISKIHDSETAPGAAPAPGIGGARGQVRASVSDDGEYDIEDYRTGGDE